MLDVLNWARDTADGGTLRRLGVQRRGYVLATIHRPQNTDDLTRLRQILDALNALAEPVVFPAHPRTRHAIARTDWRPASSVCVIPPVGYRDMIALAEGARVVATDSGGLQKEAYWLGVPCLTLRDETEWVETLEAGGIASLVATPTPSSRPRRPSPPRPPGRPSMAMAARRPAA